MKKKFDMEVTEKRAAYMKKLLIEIMVIIGCCQDLLIYTVMELMDLIQMMPRKMD